MTVRFDPARTVTIGQLIVHAHQLLATPASPNADYERDVMATLIVAAAGLPRDEVYEVADMIRAGVPGELRPGPRNWNE